MPTNFPTSVDNFTNPTANDSLNLPSHSTQHANANDAIEAVEDYLLNGNGRAGLQYLSTTTLTTITNTTISNVFNSTFANYRIVITGSGTAAQDLFVRMATTGTPDASAQYQYQTLKAGTTAVSAAMTTTQTRFESIAYDSSQITPATIEIYQPNMATSTGFQSSGGRYDQLWLVTGRIANSTVYDGINLFTGSGSFTGTMRVYGYRNS